jgi:hypothetical protein
MTQNYRRWDRSTGRRPVVLANWLRHGVRIQQRDQGRLNLLHGKIVAQSEPTVHPKFNKREPGVGCGRLNIGERIISGSVVGDNHAKFACDCAINALIYAAKYAPAS